MNRTRLIFILLIYLMLQWGCASHIVVKDNNDELRQKSARMINNMVFDNQTENEIVSDILYNIFYYLNEKYGSDKFDQFYQKALKSSDLAASIRDVYGKRLYRLGIEMFRDLDTTSSDTGSSLLSTDLGIFRIYYVKDSKADHDMPYIKYLLKTYYEELSRIYLSSYRLNNKVQLLLNKMSPPKIEVYFFENTGQAKKYFPGFSSTAQAFIRSEKVDDANYHADAGIAIKYYNILSSAVFVHELTHLIFLISNIPDSIIGNLTPVEGFSVEEVKRISESIKRSAGGVILGEGLAEYITEKYSLFYKYHLLSDVDEELNYEFCSNGLLSLKELLKKHDVHAVSIWDLLGLGYNRELIYQQGHSITRFIINNYGNDKFVKLLLSNKTDKDFKEILGEDIDTVNRKWFSKFKCKTSS
ncbi:MAG: hypothetical protein VST71_06320 [Nitrospirota bacterium]|nr:hypothetical protein [Nitrospirota bacterium]